MSTHSQPENLEKNLPEPLKNQARPAVRDEYSIDFLEPGEEHSERELESAIIAGIEQFLREMGVTGEEKTMLPEGCPPPCLGSKIRFWIANG